MPKRFAAKQTIIVQLSLAAVMSAFVAVATLLVRVPNPMGGYFNLGDVAIFIVALTFNPVIGGVAGGVGSAIADMIGFPVFVIPTLLVKGLEGFLAGMISNKKTPLRDMLAVLVGGGEMILGYFLIELIFLQWGLGGALGEVPGNVGQIIIGAVLGIPIAYVVRRRLPEILK